MMKRKPTAPSHVDLVWQADRERPMLTWRERQAIRRLTVARRRDRSYRGGFDPLELRLGLQADLRQRRPYYAIWSPFYHELLRSKPVLDDSLPGPAWLRTVYRGQWRSAVTMPGVRAVLQAREEAFAAQYATRQAPITTPILQADLFGSASG